MTTVISVFLSIIPLIFLESFVELLTGNRFDVFVDLRLKVMVSISLFIGCFAFLWDGVLLGLDKPKEFSVLSILSATVGFLVCSYLLMFQNTIETLWVSINASLIIRAGLGYIFQK